MNLPPRDATTEYDLAIVGGGPAGSILAALTARRGLKVLVFEYQKQSKRKVCGEYLCPKGVEKLKELGLGKALEHGREMLGMTLVAPNGTRVPARFARGYPGYSIHRDVFDEEFLETVQLTNAMLIRGFRVEKVEFAESRWRIICGDQEYHAKLLVGADGRQSLVSRYLENESSVGHDRVALHSWISTEARTGQSGEMHILSDGSYIGLNPTGDREWNVSWVTERQRLKEQDPAEYFRQLCKNVPSLADKKFDLSQKVIVHSAYPIRHGVKAVSGPTWALVGDAAGFLDPLTGEGLFHSIQTACLLDQCLRKESFENEKKLSGALSQYKRIYQKEFRQKQSLNRILQMVISMPRVCNGIGRYLGANQKRADAFMGVIANTTSPASGFFRMLVS